MGRSVNRHRTRRGRGLRFVVALAVVSVPCVLSVVPAGRAFGQDWSEAGPLEEAGRLVTTLSYLKGLDETTERRLVAFYYDPARPGAADEAQALVDAFIALVNDTSRKASLTNKATAIAAPLPTPATPEACEGMLRNTKVAVAVMLPSLGDAAWRALLVAAERRHVVTATVSRGAARRAGPSFGLFKPGGRLQTWCDTDRVMLEGQLNASGIPWVFRGERLVRSPTGGSEGGGSP